MIMFALFVCFMWCFKLPIYQLNSTNLYFRCVNAPTKPSSPFKPVARVNSKPCSIPCRQQHPKPHDSCSRLHSMFFYVKKKTKSKKQEMHLDFNHEMARVSAPALDHALLRPRRDYARSEWRRNRRKMENQMDIRPCQSWRILQHLRHRDRRRLQVIKAPRLKPHAHHPHPRSP